MLYKLTVRSNVRIAETKKFAFYCTRSVKLGSKVTSLFLIPSQTDRLTSSQVGVQC